MSDINRLNGVAVMPPLKARQPPSDATEKANRKNGTKRSAGSTPKRSGQRFKMLNDFVDISMQDMTPRQIAVWLCLFRDSRAGVATAAQAYIAKRCGLKRPTVSTTISELEALGLVTTLHRGGINRGLSRYRVNGIIDRG